MMFYTHLDEFISKSSKSVIPNPLPTSAQFYCSFRPPEGGSTANVLCSAVQHETS